MKLKFGDKITIEEKKKGIFIKFTMGYGRQTITYINKKGLYNIGLHYVKKGWSASKKQ